VALGDIRGDLQSHSHWSDGLDTLETMAQAADALGYEYLAITDHAHQFADREAFEQRRRADRATQPAHRCGRPYLLNAIEVNILPDGNLHAPEWMLCARRSLCWRASTRRTGSPARR
jgi:DNA polymerase (family X)